MLVHFNQASIVLMIQLFSTSNDMLCLLAQSEQYQLISLMNDNASRSRIEEEDSFTYFNDEKWTLEERTIFLQALESFGIEWSKISVQMKWRNSSQIHSHDQKCFIRKDNSEYKIANNKKSRIDDQKSMRKGHAKQWTNEEKNRSFRSAATSKELISSRVKPIQKERKYKASLKQQSIPKDEVKNNLFKTPEKDLKLQINQNYQTFWDYLESKKQAKQNPPLSSSYFMEVIVPKFYSRGYDLMSISRMNLYQFINGELKMLPLKKQEK